MAQLVVVEPGDILVFGRQEGFEVEAQRPLMGQLKDLLGLSLIVILDGPVDLGVIRQGLTEGGFHAVAGS